MKKHTKTLVVVAIILVAFNLRAPITAVGSLVKFIKMDYPISDTVVGLITTLPLLAFAFISPFVAVVANKFGLGKIMFSGLILILIGLIIRSYTGLSGIFIGTAFLGIGIAVGNVLIPSIIKSQFPEKIGIMTSIYTSSMCLFAAIGAGISMPVANSFNFGWNNSLAIWIALTIITLTTWTPLLKLTNNQQNNLTKSLDNNSKFIWKSSLGWWVTLFMGIQSLIFYSLTAWLPTIIESKGFSENFASSMALTYQLIAIPATLLVPILLKPFKNQRFISIIISGIYALSILIFILAKSPIIMIISIVLMSIAMGGAICLAIAFISLRTSCSKHATELSGMSQSVGYLLAAIGPAFTGYLFDIFDNWNIALIIFIVLLLFLAICGYFSGSNKVIKE